MDKLKMHSLDKLAQNIEMIGKLFPNAITEVVRNGEIEHAIDFDILRQELSDTIVEGREDRYQFTWPDKKKAILAANAPITATLRPVKEESVGKDGTSGGFDSENLYIEGDNLEVLKLLQETYLGKIKMIYIDPPYNTGNDFVYEDNFSQSTDEYMENSGQYDEEGNRMVANTESNGRFHTDWLNMIYPRLKLAKDLLSDDGVLFASIDYNENYNLRKVLNEIFGESSFIGEIYWESKTKSQNTSTSFNKLQPKAEMIFVYSKAAKKRFNLIKLGERQYPLQDKKGEYREYVLEVMDANGIRGRASMVFAISDGVSTVSPPMGKQWKLGQDQVASYKKQGDLFIRDTKVIIKMRPEYERSETTDPFWGFFSKEIGTAESAKKELKNLLESNGFETVKPVDLLKRLCYHVLDMNDIVLDFFSGSSTTAHAVMQLNAEDGRHRKFIMVQLPEPIDEKSEAYKAGYKNICEIGKERIRRAGRKIKEDTKLTNTDDLDIGFRCLRLDESNMENVYYTPDEVNQDTLFSYVDNIKAGRTAEDLLFQVMLDLGVLLSSPIEVTRIMGKQIFNVADGFLLACFDADITEDTVKAIAQMKPYYAVFCDGSMGNDSVATNFEQIFETYSPDTVRKIL